MRTNGYRLNVLLIVCLLVSLLPSFGATAQAAETGGGSVTNEVYAVSLDGSKKLKVDYVNFNVNKPSQKTNYVALYTSGAEVNYGYVNHELAAQAGKVFVKYGNTAIFVNAQGDIIRAVGGPPWEADQYIAIPEGGYALVSHGTTHRGLLYDFKDGTIALERDGARLTAVDFLSQPVLQVSAGSVTTVTTATYNIQGKVLNYASGIGLAVKVGDVVATVQADGTFSQTVTLAEGTNSISVKLLKNADVLQDTPLTIVYQKPTGDLIEIEAPPADITIIVEGPKKTINYVDKDVTGIPNIIALFTTEYGSKIQIPATNVALQVDANGKVTKMINAANGNSTPSWVGGELDIPQGGYVVMAQDNSYNTYDIKKYLATKFKVGDVVKLRKNGNVVPVSDLMSGLGAVPRMQLDGMTMYTTAAAKTTISGKITNPTGASVKIGDQAATLQADGTFSLETALAAGPNYIDVVLSKNGSELDRKSVVVYSRPSLTSDKQVILWVDQAANAKKLQSSESVLNFLKHAKDAGVTDIAFDVKGVEGFVSYKKNDLTNRPYVSEMTANDRKGSNPDLDLLELFLTHGHALGLKVHAAFNVFAEGSIAMKDYAIIDQHLDWEERVYRADDNGEIKRLRESAYGQRGLNDQSNGAVVLFVNPSNDEVRDFQLKTFEEVMKNYDVDGIILDRGRYDNESADFSDLTKAKFATFLQQRGKTLTNWPADIFKYTDGKRVDGPLIQDWWEFRSGTIESFVKETRDLVDRYTASKGKKIQTSAYVGAWYESYYLNGVHWGSKNFRYDSRLKFPTDSIYTNGYYQTGYIDHMDFLMVGTYYSTIPEIQRYITIDSIVTNGEVPLYSGMALADLQSPELQREIFQTAMGSSNGLMLFDASLANWPIVKASIRDEAYVKDYQIGLSKPGNPSSFIEANFYNVSRNLGDLTVYNEEFGTSTGTNRFGVEVVADSTGKVVKMVNKSQAINWSWGSPQDNNSAIPQGGMVISALDENGVRTKRQLIANTYNVGDDVRSAALSGFMNYNGKTVSTATPELTGNVKVLGAGSSVNVLLNETAATIDSNGDFAGKVNLQEGGNTVTFAVYVDGMKTNEKSIQLTYDPNADAEAPAWAGNAALTATNVSQTQLQLTWSGATDNTAVTGYKLYQGGQEIATVTGNVYDVTGLLSSTSYTFKVEAGDASGNWSANGPSSTVTTRSYSSGTSGPSGGTTSPQQPTTKPTDTGVTISATAVQTTDENGKPAMKVTLDADTVAKALAALKQQGSTAKEIVVEVSSAQPVAILSLPASALAGGAIDGAVFVIKSGGVTYYLPADLIDIDALASAMGVASGDLVLTVTLEKKTGTEAEAIADEVEKQGGEMIGDAYDFRIIVQAGGKTLALDNFGSRYVERAISLTGNVPGRATAVVIDPATGEMTFVPARFAQADGVTTVVIKRTGNSTYAVVSYGKAFKDTQGHWAEADIGLLASKLLVKGVTDSEFAPDQSITRAEFAALLVRALGLAQQDGRATFNDVRSTDWYASDVATASKAGLIDGYEDGSFRPNQVISREELAVLASRAFDFSSLKSAAGASNALQPFADADKISAWARNAAARAVSEGIMNGIADSAFAPKEQSSRAQAVVMLKRLAIKLGLMDNNE
ncbi:S-layer protein [Paenibacillus hemerocallicola]|uniref:S-layer protein n=1 Tax=Paenibacillus hemerocallicola TaxID=1172614 RepID=A0A5C4T5N6_9BACL|nr:S-layer homology domain-containing protein [Paenibacillus hemerocallicola]TNJ64358.1 S-layer protein [Paenibacillus hemerocallicola]